MLKQVMTTLDQSVEIRRLIIGVATNTETSESEVVCPQNAYRSFQATVTGTNAVAVVDIEVSVNGTNWMKALTLTPKVGIDDGMCDFSPWPYVRAVVNRNTGTLNVSMGC